MEIGWAIALKQSEGFTKLVPTLIFLPIYVASTGLLALALKELQVGTAYAVWVGIGAVGSALAGIVLLSESSDLSRLIPIGLIAIGVVWLALGESGA